MFVSQVKDEVLDLWKRVVRGMEGRSRERRIPTRCVGCVIISRVEHRKVFEWQLDG